MHLDLTALENGRFQADYLISNYYVDDERFFQKSLEFQQKNVISEKDSKSLFIPKHGILKIISKNFHLGKVDSLKKAICCLLSILSYRELDHFCSTFTDPKNYLCDKEQSLLSRRNELLIKN